MKLPVTRRKFLSFIGLGAVAPALLAQSKPDVSALWFSVDMAKPDDSVVILQSRLHPDDALGITRITGDVIRTGAIQGNAWSTTQGIQIDLNNDIIILDDPWEYLHE